jgi:IS30 family transposase
MTSPRRWAMAWSPEQISARLKMDFLDDEIYQALYVQGRGALGRELTACCAAAGHCGSPEQGVSD